MCSLRLVNQSQTTYCDEKFLDVHGIRLTPPFLEFTQAYEGKTYNKQLSIQNIGKSPVVVRITPPSSYAFKIKPLKAYKLSPGLTLVRNVTYVYSYANSPSCIVPIYINEHRFDYYIIA
ncbi:hypothetical protein QE152_g24575 [Popillia japonica]|uniref:MSP domain-containing protein n=1 Tax=Popillia japonica TaxID=7064 RepID=A0AAW1K4M2_POPJA